MNQTEIIIPHYGKDKPYLGKEDDLQKACFRWITFSEHSRAIIFHPPNGGKRNGKEAMKFKHMGVLPGVSDFVVLEPRQRWNGLIIELKTKGGKIQDTQEKFLKKCLDRGYFAAVVWSVDSFKELIDWYFDEPKK